MRDIIAIAAVAENNVIGRDGGLPWHLPEDLKFFKAQTLGKPVILGRKTWESFGCRPLPNRPHFVITTQKDYHAEGATVCTSIEEAIKAALKEAERLDQTAVMIIGGAEIYRQAYPYLTKMILTRVHQTPEGDTIFPDFSQEEWVCTTQETHPTHAYQFYSRIEAAFCSTKATI